MVAMVNSVAKPLGGHAPKPLCAGFVRNSFVDWPARISFVVFLGGCNFRCPHCHNHNIMGSTSNTTPWDSVVCEIRAQIGFIDGVVISGGEPTTHPNLRQIIDDILALGLDVKLDTNGSNFEILRDLVTAGKLSAVAMDIKCPFDRYVELGFCKDPSIVESVRRSFDFLRDVSWGTTSPKPSVYFRTTPIPELTEHDFAGIETLVNGLNWTRNTFVPLDKHAKS